MTFLHLQHSHALLKSSIGFNDENGGGRRIRAISIVPLIEPPTTVVAVVLGFIVSVSWILAKYGDER